MTQTGRWESEGGAEPSGPATDLPAQKEQPVQGSTVPSHEAAPQEIGESG